MMFDIFPIIHCPITQFPNFAMLSILSPLDCCAEEVKPYDVSINDILKKPQYDEHSKLPTDWY